VNHWPDRKCAKAFWTQRELPPYRQLLNDTASWLDPKPGERWIDLGCGSGQLTRTLWEKSRGKLAEVVSLDCADANAQAIEQLRLTAEPADTGHRIHFQHADFSNGLNAHTDCRFDGAVSGLAIQYAQSFAPDLGWTTEAYDHLVREVRRVLRPGGRFVFSVNVPEPAWFKIALYGVPGFFRARHPLRYFRNSMRMLKYGSWLKQEARRGRFHYLPAPAILAKLRAAGFERLEHRLSFARQAYVFRCYRSP
jgi:SAM-dependent methyltransferase